MGKFVRMFDLRGVEFFSDCERKEIVQMTLTLFILIATSSNIVLLSLTKNDLWIIAHYYLYSAVFLVIYYACILLNSLNHDRLLFKWLDVVLFLNLVLAVVELLLLVWSFSTFWLVYVMRINLLSGVICGVYSLIDSVISIRDKLWVCGF